MSQRAPDDDERDAWLSQALRHAPDASADASPGLSETILREARAAAARPALHASPSTPAPRGAGPSHWLVSAWDWLARPPVAAGFASVMVATLVGILWWDRPLDETLPRLPAPAAAAPESRAEAAAPMAADTQPTERAAPVSPAVERAKAKPSIVAPKKSARPPRLADEPARERADASAPPAPVLPTAQPAAAPQAAAKLAAEAAADKAASLHNELRAAPGNSGRALGQAGPTDAGSAPLAELLASVAQQPERWRWQRGNGSAQPMTPALQRWLTQFDRSTAARWRAAPESAAREAASALRLLRDGVPQATLGFAGSGVWVETGGASAPAAAMALLPPTSTETLRKALDQAAP